MTKRKEKKKLKKPETTVTRATDFPNAPGLLAIMLAGDVVTSVTKKKYAQVADGHD